MSVRIPRSTLILLGVLLVVEIADVFTTRYGFVHGYWEVNPFAAWLIARGGLALAVLYKAVTYAAIVLLARLFSRKFWLWVQVGIVYAIGFIGSVVAMNLISLHVVSF